MKYELSDKEVAALRECIDVTVRTKGTLVLNTAQVLLHRLTPPTLPIPVKKEKSVTNEEKETAKEAEVKDDGKGA